MHEGPQKTRMNSEKKTHQESHSSIKVSIQTAQTQI